MRNEIIKNLLITKGVAVIGFVLLSSCCGLHTEIEYEYSGIKIQRVDECGRTTFYYNNDKNESYGIIWTEYSGINDGFKGYLKFGKNGQVLILSGDGYFQSKNLDTAFFNYKSIYAYNRPETGESVCGIMLSTRYEKEFNSERNTEIKATYKIDKNEWW